MSDERKPVSLEEILLEQRKTADGRRQFTSITGNVFVGCNEYCGEIGEERGVDEFAYRKKFKKGRNLIFCSNPRAPKLPDGSMPLCLVYIKYQSSDLIKGVKSGNLRQASIENNDKDSLEINGARILDENTPKPDTIEAEGRPPFEEIEKEGEPKLDE